MIKIIDNKLDAIKLIKRSYLALEAKNDSISGQKEFLNNYVNDLNHFFYGYYIDDVLVGVISINEDGYIKYLFIDSNYINQKIGTKLLDYIINEYNYDEYYLDSSIYAKDFYLKYGFKQISDILYENEMSYIKMKYVRRKTNV